MAAAETIQRLELYRLPLPLTTPLIHSQVATAVLDELFLVVTLAGGARGASEVRGNGAYATGYDADAVIEALASGAGELLGVPACDAACRLLTRSGNRLAAALLDGAAYDALARNQGIPLWRYLGRADMPCLSTHASIALLSPHQAASRARAAVADGFCRLKVRVGAEDDLERVSAVRSAAPSASLILDANGAWPATEAIAMAEQLAPFRIAWLEQPTAPHDDDALQAVRERGRLRIVADESVRTAEDVRRLAAIRAVDGVHLKLEKCGTVAELRQAACVARDAGLLVEIGMMDQGRLGSANIANIASTIPADAYELWGFERVGSDVCGGFEIEAGMVRLSERSGNGVEPSLPAQARAMVWE